ncbi:hypothetical protein BU24DRAFT_423395 [Aaosphaeria arxii CBS 175.79]|uniref:Hydrophobin n=1 Tax=Aaosphaeria arxii CBS 175.79 TaxID=1450172 RepID=A0A6A5XNI8_9PLEO|nr:uncharacterized protein BU24DRAFT_423395 [Aaosphaeria arxii CBS 175.79]KAF2014459.1 hypothetical protein BU24DRAFT_423395 [Aaosphaeria arxii CBS 175.79]
MVCFIVGLSLIASAFASPVARPADFEPAVIDYACQTSSSCGYIAKSTACCGGSPPASSKICANVDSEMNTGFLPPNFEASRMNSKCARFAGDVGTCVVQDVDVVPWGQNVDSCGCVQGKCVEVGESTENRDNMVRRVKML